MPPASAARKFDPTPEESFPHDPGPASEQARYEPRFRVVTRAPLAAPRRRRRTQSVQRSIFLVAVPGFMLLVYVAFWALAMRGGYYRDQLLAQRKSLRIEQSELEAEKRRLQSPQFVLDRARTELGMQPAEQRQFAQLPAHGTHSGSTR